MDWRTLRRRLSPRRMIEEDVREELAFHIEERAQELVRKGWDPHEARTHILSRFGDLASIEERCRTYDTHRIDGAQWRLTMEAWWRDLKFALRTLLRNPGFSAVIVTTLAIGLGATTAVFSVVEGVLLRPLPFGEPDRLAMVWQNDRASGTVRENASMADYYDYLDRGRSFSDMAVYALGTSVYQDRGTSPRQLNTARVSRNMLDVLGLSMHRGRMFTEEEDLPDGPRAVILTHEVWRSAFGASEEVIGARVSLDDVPHEIVGVLPPGIDFPVGETELWTPIRQTRANAPRTSHWARVVGRLAEGRTIEGAQAEMSAIMTDLEVEYPGANLNRGAFVEPLGELGRGGIRSTLWVLFGAVLAVLLIACVNIANLLLARGAGRARELALFTAVGAGMRDLSRRFLAEALLLTAVGGGIGIGLAVVGVRLLSALAPAGLATVWEPKVNGPVLAFACGVSVLISVGFALLPSFQARRLDIQTELKDGRAPGPGAVSGLGLRRLLVAAQLALAVVLLLGATLLIDTVKNLQAIDPGFRAERALRVDFALPASRYPDFSTYPNWPEIFTTLHAIEDEAGAIPGISSSAILLNHPLDRGFTNSFQIEGQSYDPENGEMATRLVTPSYFATVGLELVEGRLLDGSERIEAASVVLINRAAAERFFPDGDAVGTGLAFWGPDFREIVGIVENERMYGLTADAPPAIYLSLYQSPPRGGKITLMARTDVPPLDVAEAVRMAIQRVDPGTPVFNVSTMEATVLEEISRERFASTLLTIFAGVAIFLALLGVHGVLAYLVAQRGHEVGVRMALGATRRDVVRMIVRQGVRMTLAGVGVGLVVAYFSSGALRTLLYEVSPTAPGAYVGVGSALAVVALAATAFPAWRAASIDPVSSMRTD